MIEDNANNRIVVEGNSITFYTIIYTIFHGLDTSTVHEVIKDTLSQYSYYNICIKDTSKYITEWRYMGVHKLIMGGEDILMMTIKGHDKILHAAIENALTTKT